MPTTRHATIHQVGVSEGCAVQVLVAKSLTTLDAFDGLVRGRLLLSSRHRSEQTDPPTRRCGASAAIRHPRPFEAEPNGIDPEML
jgi:hypothetical protein